MSLISQIYDFLFLFVILLLNILQIKKQIAIFFQHILILFTPIPQRSNRRCRVSPRRSRFLDFSQKTSLALFQTTGNNNKQHQQLLVCAQEPSIDSNCAIRAEAGKAHGTPAGGRLFDNAQSKESGKATAGFNHQRPSLVRLVKLID